MKMLLIWLFAAALATPALAERHGGAGHPAAAHRTMQVHTARARAHVSAHRRAVPRTTHRTARHSSHHHLRHITHHASHHATHRSAHRATHRAVHHAARHVAGHVAHATTARGDQRYAKVRRAVRAMRRFHAGNYRRPGGWYSHHWIIGERLPRAWFARDYWLSDWAMYGLWAPIDGLIWVRVGPDAVLVDPASGDVVGIEYGLFF